MEIAKEGAQSLRMKMPAAELYLKELFTAFSCVQQDCPNLRESCKG